MGELEVEAIEVLIKAGADVNRVDRRGRTPVFCAARVGNLEVVEALVKAGADPASSRLRFTKEEIEELESTFEPWSGKEVIMARGYINWMDIKRFCDYNDMESDVEEIVQKFFDIHDGLAFFPTWSMTRFFEHFGDDAGEAPALPPLCSAAQNGHVSAIQALYKENPSKSFLNQTDM